MSIPATAVPPTDTAKPPITVTIPVPSETPIPTAIPVTPTSEVAQVAEYLAKSENKYPIKLIDGLGEFFGTLDFGNIIFVNEKSPDGEEIRSYCVIRDGGINFLAPCYLKGHNFLYDPLSITIQQFDPDYKFEVADLGVRIAYEKMAELLGVTGRTARVKVLVGYNPEAFFKGEAVPYRTIFDASDWDEATLEFMQTGNYKLLPIKTINGITGYLLPAIRITIVDSVTTTP